MASPSRVSAWDSLPRVAGQGDRVRVDGDGIHFSDGFTGSADVYFGEHRGWSFTREQDGPGLVRWPKKMHRFLQGWSQVRVVAGEAELFAGRVVFTPDDGEVAMVDRHGLPVIVDKWGLIQKPFAGRAEGVLGVLADEAQRILDVLADSCGLPGWISFGTLLGAARSGKAIGHDSDVDLCYLSEKATPAEMTTELWSIARALRAAGMRVVLKSGSFLTVQVRTPDGAGAGIDLYTTFFLDDLLYETATVRAPVPRSAVLPLKPIEFEGRMLPGPADPAALLEVSYGPGWRVPDPSFKHEPGREIVERFDGWFGHLWRQRRDWKAHNADIAAARPPASEFAVWLAGRLPAGTRVVDLGAGHGADAHHLAEAGFEVLALDYALPGRRRWPQHPNLRRENLNLYDERDVLTCAVLLARHLGPQVFYARNLLETLAPDGRAAFWRLVATGLRGGGDLHLESQAWSAAAAAGAHRRTGSGGKIRSLSPRDVVAAARRTGAVVTHQQGLTEATHVLGGPADAAPVTWRMGLRWPGNRTESAE